MPFRRTAAALLLAFVALGSTAVPASAHTELKSSDPAKGAAMPAPPQQVQLTFSEPVTLPADAIAVTGPGGVKWTVGQIAVTDAVVTAPVTATGPAGAYAIAWTVISADGDPVSGTIDFTLSAPATTTTTTTVPATTTTTATSSVTPAAQVQDDSGGVPASVWILVAVLVAAGVGAVLFLRRRVTASPD
ncbi:copper resistance CopC family protein [Lentzea cavernae]|uniref:Copper resistance protein n=1 Tax=Lentzea cavernae TaxID=2020703 RepID=A0ABQ3M2S3_9PSEU|nr:copper resistance CopC family protein [Lentzea cavernae]GHH27903.1 copper resistance protein [Lentzea cavernae]